MDTDPDGNSIIFQLLLLLCFTLMNAFFAGAEMAVVSVNRNRIRSLAEGGNKKAKVIQGLFEDSTKFLSTIQVAITFAGFYSSASAAAGIAPSLAEWLSGLHVPYSLTIARNSVTLLLMFFNLVFAELVPKRIALQKAETFCMVTVMPIHYISIVLSPFIKLLSVSTKVVLRILHLKTEDEKETVTEEEIMVMLKMGCESGTFNATEQKMISSVFTFDEKTAREVMVPRHKVFCVDIEELSEKKIDEILQRRHSRVPVYKNDIDNIIGILHIKDVMIRMREGNIFNKELKALLHKPYFIPEMKDADCLLREMQKKHVHMAILIDEYGGFSGIVTIEDLLEEIVGDIYEEYEKEEPEIAATGEGEYLLDGGLSLATLNAEFGIKLESEGYDTISGYLIESLGYIPNEQKGGEIEACGYQFQVKKTEGNTICKVFMKKL